MLVGDGTNVGVGVIGVDVGGADGVVNTMGRSAVEDGKLVAVGRIGVTVSVGVSESGKDGSCVPAQIRATPTRLEKILDKTDILGTSISFAFTPPPNSPTRRAMQPAIVRTIGKVIIFSLS